MLDDDPYGRSSTAISPIRARTRTVDTDLYHEDAVLEFPQSGERFEGLANFLEWRRMYPSDVAYRIRRIARRGDLVVIELTISYDGGPWMFGVSIMDFRGAKVAREHIYVMEGWEPPEWRAPWRAALPEVDDFAGFSSVAAFDGEPGAGDLLWTMRTCEPRCTAIGTTRARTRTLPARSTTTTPSSSSPSRVSASKGWRTSESGAGIYPADHRLQDPSHQPA